MNTYVVVSNRPWVIFLFERLKSDIFGKWILIQERENFSFEYLCSIEPEYIFIPNWSYTIEDDIIEKFNCVIFHETDLPFGRGGSPVQNLIARGHNETLISAIKAVSELDAGPVYLKRELSLLGGIEEIFLRSNEIIHEMIKEIIQLRIVPEEQEGEPTVFKRRKTAESSIKELNVPEDVFNFIRMLDSDSYPRAFYESDYFIFEFSRPKLKHDKTILADVRIIPK